MIVHWILASRPKTLLAAFSPVAIGTTLAIHDGGFHLLGMLGALMAAMTVQIGTNFCNDYCDFFQGADTEERKGPTRAVQSGLISPRAMLIATVVMFSLTALFAVLVSLRAGWPFLVLGGFSILFGVLYTAGRFSLAYMGIADPFVLFFFGPVAVVGTHYIQTLDFSWPAFVIGFGPGLIATGLLVVNNLRDIDEDRQANKLTLAVRLGATFSRLQYTFCIFASALVPVAFVILRGTPLQWGPCLASLVLAPGLLVTRKVWRSDGIALRPCLGMTAGAPIAVYGFVLCRIEPVNESAELRAYRFRIPFRRNIVLAGQSVSHREGILLERNDQWAEASPLPGFSSESIEDVVLALQGSFNDVSLPASLDFALSSLNLPTQDRIQVPLNKLLMGDRQQIFDDAKACELEGFKAVKLKVGRDNLESDITLVRQVRSHLPQHIQLRLDANQAWTLQQAERFAQGIQGLDIQYIEEPLQESRQLEELYSRTQLPYALDETLVHANSLEDWPNAAALVCKPTILGGREKIEPLIATGKPVVFSSAFESGIGIARIMQFAAEFSPNTPAGLDTLSWISDDLLIRSPRQQDGVMVLEQLEVNTKPLESILS